MEAGQRSGEQGLFYVHQTFSLRGTPLMDNQDELVSFHQLPWPFKGVRPYTQQVSLQNIVVYSNLIDSQQFLVWSHAQTTFPLWRGVRE